MISPRINRQDNSEVRSAHDRNKTEKRKTQPNEAKHIKVMQEAMTMKKDAYASKKSLSKTRAFSQAFFMSDC